MQVLDAASGKLVGHLADVSEGGFKLDCQTEIPVGRDFRLLINLSPEVSNKPMMVFVARSKWSRRDDFDPTSFLVGFQIINMPPADRAIFRRMFDLYGEQRKRSW